MLGWEWYGDTNVVRVFLHCLLKANYMEKKWCGIVIGRGQFLTSVATMAQELHLSAQQIRTAINKLKSTNEITINSTNKYTIVTICNYESYQATDTPKQQTRRQVKQQSGNNQITNEQQTNNNNIRITEYTDSTEYTDIQTTPYGVIDGASPSPTQSTKGKFNFKGYLLEHGASEQAVNDWLEVRKKKRAANTLSAINNLEREASKAGISLAEAVDMCAGNSWQSLKAEWILKDQGQPTAPEGQDDLDAMAKQWRQQLQEMRAADGREPGQFKDL